MRPEMKREIESLIMGARSAVVCSVDEMGCPNAKAMLTLDRDGMGVHYFSTPYYSKRAQQFLKNPKACVYFLDAPAFLGLMLTGTVRVRRDRPIRERLWREGFEIYYPAGIDEENYCVLEFTAAKGDYYGGKTNTTFTMEEYENA
jgi:general stress protein 26